MSHYVINFEDITKRINTFDNAKWPGFYSKEIEKPKRNGNYIYFIHIFLLIL